MKLEELLGYEHITVQCHDNPDADALASGFGLYSYLSEKGVDVKFIYSGRSEISKDNLVMMVESLQIPVEYHKDNTERIQGLLITVDCQYGASNVTRFEADDVMIIDHHQQEIENIEKTYIISNMGSCSTIVWKMLCEAGYNLADNRNLQTALYYGLYTDTGQFAALSNPFDKDMMDAVRFDRILIHRLQNSNLNAKELEIVGEAMVGAIVNNEQHYAVVQAAVCDPNILGLLSDLILQVSEVDYCVIFSVMDHGIKFSTRSCVKEVKADHLAAKLAKGIGSGGGHINKAGGFISRKEYEAVYGSMEFVTFFANKMDEQRNGYDIIDTETMAFDRSGSRKYRKKNITVGFVRATDVLPVGAETMIRTLEGDVTVTVAEDMYIMIGIKGEVYPIREAKFRQAYKELDEPYRMELEYHPKAKLKEGGMEYSILEYAKSCVTTGEAYIYAKPLCEKGAKVFTAWDRNSYMLGEVGDYLAAKTDDLSDMYIVEHKIFDMTYELVEE